MSRLFCMTTLAAVCFLFFATFIALTSATEQQQWIELTAANCGQLTNLAGTVIKGKDSTDSSTNYEMTMCALSTEAKCAADNGSICQYKNSVYSASLGSFTKLPAPTFTTGTDNLAISFPNGSACRGVVTTTSTVNATCGSSNSFTVTAKPGAGCAYSIDLKLKNIEGVCSGPSGVSGLSTGALILIVVFSVAIVYVVAGCLVCHFKFGQPFGIAALPQHEFWLALPSLFIAGVGFFIGKIKGLTGSSATITSSEGEYEEV